MKNIVKVLRLKDNAARLYTLPEDAEVKKGTVVFVEYPNKNNLCLSLAISDSYKVDGETEQMVAQMHRIANLDSLKRVISVCEEKPLDWPQADPDDEADTEAKEVEEN